MLFIGMVIDGLKTFYGYIMLKWTKREQTFTFEKEFPIIGLVFGEIFQEDNGFTLEIEAYEDRYSTKIDTFIEIKTIEKAKAIAEKEIIKLITREANKAAKFLSKYR